MLKPLQRLFPIALSLSLAACGGSAGGGTTASSGTLPALPASGSTGQTVLESTSAQSSYSSIVSSDTPVAYYPLSDSTRTAVDATGNGLDGTVGSSVQLDASGIVPSTNAMAFPGTRSAAGAIRVAATSMLQPASAVSIESLFRFAAEPANYTVLAAYGQRSGNATYELFFKNGQIIAQFTRSSGLTELTSPTLQANTAYDAVATYSGTTASLYLNGKLVASSAATGSLTYVSGYGLSIGDDASSSNPAFSGTIGNVAVYNKALSASQVSAHYSASTSAGTVSPTSAPTAGAKPTSAPTANPTAAPTAKPVATPTAAPVSGTTIWKAGDATLGKWTTANTYQCGNPVNSGTTFTFGLSLSGTSCGRNQANPLTSSGSTVRLADGGTYTWSFNYVDGTPSGGGPGMGSDNDARSLIWQIHGYNEPDTPCTSLNFVNGTKDTGGPQMWALMTCCRHRVDGNVHPG